jgi:ribosomal protein L16 Arg81 hydroxylase
MVGRTHDLASLLDPISPGDFFSDYWGEKPLFIQRGDGGYYQELLTNRDIENIISTSDVRYPAIGLAKDGRFYPSNTFTRNVKIGLLSFDGVPDLDRISAEYRLGATITMPALHRTWVPLTELCARLEEQLDHSIHSNVYITPGQAAGFPPHYDTHDVLVLQIAGRKHWRIDEPQIRLPHDSQTFKPQGFIPGPRLMEAELVAGDLLYLPRGYVHSTTTSESHSAHVTIGINIYNWIDLAGSVMASLAAEFKQLCIENEQFREALPPGFASRTELRSGMKERLTQMLRIVSNDLDRPIDQFLQSLKAARIRVPVRFRTEVKVISASSVLQTPPAHLYRVVKSKDRLMLNFDGKEHVFLEQSGASPALIGATLDAMCTRATFRIAELPDSLDIETRLSFARYLQAIDFLRPPG